MFLLPTQLYAVQVSTLTPIVYLMIFAISWDIVSGYTGQLSFGHAFFFALGGYGTAILNIQHGVNPFLSIPIAMLLAGAGGLLIGLPAIRLQGPYLSLITLIIPVIMAQLIILWNESLVIILGGLEVPIAPGGFGGETGLDRAPDPIVSTGQSAVYTVESFQISVLANYYLALTVMTLILIVLLVITRSSTGEVMTAIREKEAVVSATGLNPVKFKLFAFLVSALVGGLGGALFVHSPIGYPQPEAILNLRLSIDVVIVTILGGTGTLVGPVVGALIFEGIDELLEEADFVIPFIGRTLSDLQPLPILALAVLTIFYMPGGVIRAAIVYGRRVTDRLGKGDNRDAEPDSLTPLESIIQKYSQELRDWFK